MTTYAKAGISKKKIYSYSKIDFLDNSEPLSALDALTHPKWKRAMKDEYNALFHNRTWSLVPPSPSMNIIGNQWVFKAKKNSDGSVQQYKARFVAKDFHQTL